MFSGRYKLHPEADGSFFIDRFVLHPNNLYNSKNFLNLLLAPIIILYFAYYFCHLQLTKRMNKRDPIVFHHILNFLRGQPPKIDSLDNHEISQILDDAEV